MLKPFHTAAHFSLFLLLLTSIVLFESCEKKFDFSTLPPDEATLVNDTSYVEIAPVYKGFVQVTAITIGGDQLLYVADYGANKIYQKNIAGTTLGETNILHPSAIAQDSRLDLLVCGETRVQRDSIHWDTVAAIYRIQLSKLDSFKLVPTLPSASVKIVWKERKSPSRRFAGIIVVAENKYIAARVGPDNGSPFDPDSRLLWFKKTDSLITPISDLSTGAGSGITYLNKPTGIIGFPLSQDFIVTQTLEGVNYGAIYMTYVHNADASLWQPAFDPTNPSQRVDFVIPNLFANATGGTLDQNRRDIFILNAGADSAGYAIFKFNIKGKFQRESIHPNIVSPPLTAPVSAAFSNRVLYIATPTIIYRFKLSTDFLQ